MRSKNCWTGLWRRRVGYQATFQVLEGERVYFEPDYLKTEAIRKVVPTEMLAWFGHS